MYLQTETPLEVYLNTRKKNITREMCGPTAAANCLKALFYPFPTIGTYRPNPAQLIFDWLNDPKNYPAMERMRDDIDPRQHVGNRIPQYYPPAMRDLFDATSYFSWNHTHEWIIEQLRAGRKVQVLLKDPSHYISVVDYDQEFIVIDPLHGESRVHTLRIESFTLVYYPRGRR